MGQREPAKAGSGGAGGVKRAGKKPAAAAVAGKAKAEAVVKKVPAAALENAPAATEPGAHRVRITVGGKIHNYVRFAERALRAGEAVTLWSAAPASIEKTISVAELTRRCVGEDLVAKAPSLEVLGSGAPQLTVALAPAGEGPCDTL